MITRRFWGWDKPVLHCAAQHLMRGWERGELDLSTTLIIVPTSEAGRRLREHLARATAEKDGAITAPHVWSPEMALLPAQDRETAATAVQARLAWVRVLMDLNLAEFPAVFPVPPEKLGWGWAMSTADMLQDLLMTLGAGGWNFSKVAASAAAASDVERWREMERLERLYRAALNQADCIDVQQCKAARAEAPRWPDSVENILVMAVLDAPPLFGTWLQNAAQRLPVEVCVHAPESLAHAFDDWGRPLPNFWMQADALPAPVALEHLHVAQNAAQQADLMVNQMRELIPAGRLALGICDAEVTACVKDRLALEEVRVFEPGGVKPQSLGLWHILHCIRDLVASESWRAFASMLRVPELRSLLVKSQSLELLERADGFATKHMPITLEHAMELLRQLPAEVTAVTTQPARRKRKKESEDQLFLPFFDTMESPVSVLQQALDAARELVDSFGKKSLHDALRALLIALYGERSFTPSAPADRSLLELADMTLELSEEIATQAAAFGLKPAAAELYSLLMDDMSNRMVTEPRGEVDLILQGWLELLWEAAPQLIVAGVNEEHVPGILVSHPFLPDSLRTALGLPSQASRYARDACLLHCLAAQRTESGSLRVLCGQWGERGDALKPSRLLMRGPATVLPQQVRRLFPNDESLPPPPQPLRQLAWQLRPKGTAPAQLKSISISQLNSYLTCPFRYYLDYVLRMSPVEAGKQEMDAGEFGTLIHAAFETVGKNPALRSCQDEAVLAAALTEAAQAEAQKTYGQRMPLMVRLQLESAIQRLQQAAKVDVLERKDGWQVLRSELDLRTAPEEQALVIRGVRITGKLDRIEQRGTELRIIDFKTSDTAGEPLKTHLKALRNTASVPEEQRWQLFSHEGKIYRWLNVQLPLYAAAAAKLGYSGAEVAYLNLPKGTQDTVIEPWADFGDEIIQGALACAEAAIERIQQGIFWPPAARVRSDSYAELTLSDPLNTVHWPRTTGTA
jgi:ATP-dependent helicase/nuclease subunit B